MDQSKSEYEFLDLSDINEEERSCLTSALFSTPYPSSRTSSCAVSPGVSSAVVSVVPHQDIIHHQIQNTEETQHSVETQQQIAWSGSHYDLSSCSSETLGPPTASSSLDSLSEREMAPPPPPHPAPSASPSHAPRPAPPPHYAQPPHNQAQLYSQPWASHLMPSNVYVSQVTANVNVHGYMSQFYQPHQHQYVAHQQAEQRGNPNREGSGGGRRGRRGGPNKRVPSPSPPQAAAPPYIYYSHPPYYPAQAAQGAPLYHMPVYPPYMPSYQYAPYVEYPIMEDPSGGEKPHEEYHGEMMMEHEQMSHEVYYPPPHQCLPPPPPNMYDPTRPDLPMEPYPATYYPVPPPQQQQQPSTHQFNVYAKNFVRQSDNKNYNNDIKPLDNNTMNSNQIPNNNAMISATVDSIPVKDLKISATKSISPPLPSKGQQANPQHAISTDKVVPKPPAESPKPAWVAANNCAKPIIEPVKSTTPPASSQSPNNQVSCVQTVAMPATTQQVIPVKINKSPLPSGQAKTTQTVQSAPGVIVPQPNTTVPAKAPFSTATKKDVPLKSHDAVPIALSNENLETTPTAAAPTPIEMKPVTAVPTVKANPPVSIAPAPIVSKAPFSHAKKPSITDTPAPVPVPTPVAPSANDFPPVPAPKRVTSDQTSSSAQPSLVVAHNPSPARTWASLFVDKSAPVPTVKPVEEAASVTTPPTQNTAVATNSTPQSGNSVINQKPVAKVGPFDASPLQRKGTDKQQSGTVPVSYSEKTSNGQVQKGVKEDSANREWQQSQASTHINDPNSYRMGEFLSKYQLSHHTVSFQPRGLSNRSNYCYINAILQALIACPPFYNMLKNLPHQTVKGKSNTPIIDAMVELIREFSPLPPGTRLNRAERINRIEANSESGTIIGGAGAPLEPGPVLRALRDVQNGGDSFRVDGRQEDAEEFLGCLLNGLNDEMMELIKLVEPPEEAKDVPVVNGGNDITQDSDDDDEWKVMGPKNKGSIERRCLAGRTPLSDIFRGQLRSRLQRVQTADSSQSETTHCVQPFFTLPLDIENTNSVNEALERVAGRERMEGVRCRERGRPVDAWSQSHLEKLPPALLLHLKCFHCRPHDNTTAKILKTIDYPVDLKIDTKIMSAKTKYSLTQRSYKLFAVVYHEGAELEKGHYLCDAYHAGSGGWLRYDDSIVTAVTESQVLHPKLPRMPYLLLYRRRDTMQPPTQRHNTPSNN